MIAIFDFDETLVRENSLRPLYRHLARPVPLWWHSLAALPGPSLRLPAVKERLKRHLYRRLFGGRTEDEIRAAATQVAAGLHLNPPVVSALHLRRQSLDVVVVASASPRLAVEAMLEALRLPVHHLIATELETRDGRLTGELEGAECLGEEKARRLRLAFQELGLEGEAVGYGNPPEDLPMLSLCAERHEILRPKSWFPR